MPGSVFPRLPLPSPNRSLQCKAGKETFRTIRCSPLTLPMRTSKPRDVVSGPVTTCSPPGSGKQGHRSASLESANSKVTLMRTHSISLVIIMNADHVRKAVPWEPRDLVLDLALPPLNILGTKFPSTHLHFITCVVSQLILRSLGSGESAVLSVT